MPDVAEINRQQESSRKAAVGARFGRGSIRHALRLESDIQLQAMTFNSRPEPSGAGQSQRVGQPITSQIIPRWPRRAARLEGRSPMPVDHARSPAEQSAASVRPQCLWVTPSELNPCRVFSISMRTRVVKNCQPVAAQASARRLSAP